MQKMKSRKRKKTNNASGKIIISAMVVILSLILSVQIVKLHIKNESYKAQQAQLEAQLEEEQQRSEDLDKQEAYVGSDEYVEDTARSKLGMANDDEIIFKEE